MLGDNMGLLISGSDPASTCNKKHSMVNYHYIRECCAAGIIQLAKVDTKDNLADGFTKPVDKCTFTRHRKQIFQSVA